MKNTRKIAIIGIFGAISTLLMYLEFPVSFFAPPFLKFDFSDLPALIVAFACGPWSAALVCLLKNLLHLFSTQTAGVGELANFIVGSCLVIPAGLVYQHRKSRKTALIGALVGAVVMSLFSFPVNYFITYPFYIQALHMPVEAIVGMYQAIIPPANTLVKALVIVNIPFTFAKGIIAMLFCSLIYKPLSPILKGRS